MVVLPGELEGLLAEGGHVETNYSPVEFLGDRGAAIGVRFIRTRQGEPGRDGRRLPVDVPGSELDIGAESGIIEKSGAWYSYNGQKIGQGRENTKMFLKDNPALMLEIEEKVKVILGIGAKVNEEAEAVED